MKAIKSILSMVLILVAVKACFFITNRLPNPVLNSSEKSEISTSSISSYSDEALYDYERYELDHGVSVALPKSWEVLTEEQVFDIKNEADSFGSETPLAANSSSYLDERIAQYRVSFTEKDFDENVIRNASLEDLRLGCEDIYNMWLQNPTSISPIGKPQCSTTTFNGKVALLTSYKRHGQSSSTWSVNVVSIPLSDKTLMITFSKRDGSAEADDVISKINSSVIF